MSIRIPFNSVGRQGTLLLDEHTVADTRNCTLHFHTAVKDPANPIIRAEKPWDGCGPYTWNSNLVFLPDKNKLRLSLETFNDAPYAYGRGYADSTDGLHWTRTLPEEVPEPVVKRSPGGRDWLPRFYAPAVRNPLPDCPPDRRYAFMDYEPEYLGVKAWFSADGDRWNLYSEEPVWTACSDIIQARWDDRLQKYTVYYKLWQLEGNALQPDGTLKPVNVLAVTFDERKTPEGNDEVYGDVFVHHTPEGNAEVYGASFIFRSENMAEGDGGGGHLTGSWHTKRVVCRAESDDFIHWTNQHKVLDVDEFDRVGSNFQIASVFQLGGYYLAALTYHDQRGFFEQQLAFGTDGIHWKRPWRGNLISRSPAGHFDGGMITAPVEPIITDTQMIFYYGGISGGHADVLLDEIAVGRAMMRRDGFAGWTAGKQEAHLVTQPLAQCYGEVLINANAEGGTVAAALLDESGTPLPGFGYEDGTPLTEDSAAYHDCLFPVSFGKPLPEGKLRIGLKFANAEVFAVGC